MVQRDLFAKPQAHQAAEINKGQEKKVLLEKKYAIANLVIL